MTKYSVCLTLPLIQTFLIQNYLQKLKNSQAIFENIHQIPPNNKEHFMI